MSSTCLTTTTLIPWKLLQKYGHDPEPLFREAGLDPILIQNPDARFPCEAVDRIWTMASEVIDDPCFAVHAADSWHPSYLGALGFAWLSSSTLRTALDRLCCYIRLETESIKIRYEEKEEGVIITLDFKRYSHRPTARIEASLSILIAMCRMNYGEELEPVGVTFMHAGQRCTGEYCSFFRAPVQFEASRNSLTLPITTIDKILPTGNPHLATLNDQVVQHYLASLDSSDLQERIKGIIIVELPSGRATDTVVAQNLNLSVRTLQRQLQNEGTSFATLLNETRQDLTREYFYDPNINLSDIAFRLGFSDHSAFSRAYKRWTGFTPSEARKLKSDPNNTDSSQN